MDDWVTGCRCEIFKLASVWGAVRHQVMWWAGVISLGPSEPPTPALGAHWNHSGPDNVWLLALRSLSTPHLWLLMLLTSCAAQASRILKTPPGDSKMQPRVRINTGGPLGNHTAFFFLYLQIVPNRHISFVQTLVKSHGLVPGWLGIAMITFSPEWLHFQLNGAVKIPSLKKNVLCCSLNLFHECKRVRDKQCQKLGRKKNVNAFKYVFPVPHEMVSQVLICCSWILEPLDWEKAYKSYFVCVCICVWVCVLSPSVEATLCDPMDGSPPGSSVHGISQVSILEPIAISYSMGSFWPWDWTRVSCVFCISRWIL